MSSLAPLEVIARVQVWCEGRRQTESKSKPHSRVDLVTFEKWSLGGWHEDYSVAEAEKAARQLAGDEPIGPLRAAAAHLSGTGLRRRGVTTCDCGHNAPWQAEKLDRRLDWWHGTLGQSEIELEQLRALLAGSFRDG